MHAVPDEAPVFFLAIDPGKATGWAALTPSDPWDEGGFAFGEITGRFEFYEAIRTWTSAGAVPEIVIEDYVFDANTHKKSRQVDALRIIGYLEGLAYFNGWQYTIQDRSRRKFATDDKLDALGWDPTTKAGHAREATRHLLVYLLSRYGNPGQVGHDLLTRIMETR